MSRALERELLKLNAEKIGDNQYIIRKDTTIHIEEDKCYVVELKNTCYDPNSLVTLNWNRGVVPKCRYYNIDVLKIVATMVQVNGFGYNLSPTQIEDKFLGWLPISEMNVLQKL